MPSINVQENGDGTTRTVAIPERTITSVVSNVIQVTGTLTSTTTSHEFDWKCSEGVFICSGTFDNATISLQQYIGTEWVTFKNGQKSLAGGFRFSSPAPKLRVLLQNHSSSSSLYYHVETIVAL